MKIFSNKNFTNILNQYPILGNNIEFYSLYGYRIKITRLTFLCWMSFFWKIKFGAQILFLKIWQFLIEKNYLAKNLGFICVCQFQLFH